jgi:hypothetical protein
MAAERPSYMFPSHWEFPPEGRIVLGSLIKDPKRAERHLYSGRVDPSLITTVSRDGSVFQLEMLVLVSSGCVKEEVFDKFALLADDEDLDAQERKRVVEYLHETWDIGELKQPTDDEQGVELVNADVMASDDLDFNILVPEVPSN